MARPMRTAPPVTSTERPRQLSRGSSIRPERSMLTAAVAPSTVRIRDGEEEQEPRGGPDLGACFELDRDLEPDLDRRLDLRLDPGPPEPPAARRIRAAAHLLRAPAAARSLPR